MRLSLTRDLYHRPDCDHPIFGTERIQNAAETVEATPEEVEDDGYGPCDHCFPGRVE